MSMTLMAEAMNAKVGHPLRKLVLIKLADNANDKGECWPSYQHIADQCEIGRSTVKAHIKALAEAGFLTIKERRQGSTSSSNWYTLHIAQGVSMSRSKVSRLPRSGDDPGQEMTGGGSGDDRGGSGDDRPPRSGADPRTSHSFEPVSEPVTEPVAPGAAPADAGGQDLLGELAQDDPSDEPRIEIPADMPGPKDQRAKTFRPWANYAMAYRYRYGVWPIWNARTAGQLGQLVDRVGAELAPAVAAYFLSMNHQFYVAKGHPVGLMLQDCETIATSVQTGQQMTATRARQMDGTQANASAADEAKRLLNASWGE